MTELLQYWPILAFLASVVVIPAISWAIRAGLASRGELTNGLADEAKARALAIGAMEARLGSAIAQVSTAQTALGDRTLRIETEIRHLPTSGDIAELKEQLARTDTHLEAMGREMQSITRALTRVEDHLVKGA